MTVSGFLTYVLLAAKRSPQIFVVASDVVVVIYALTFTFRRRSTH